MSTRDQLSLHLDLMLCHIQSIFMFHVTYFNVNVIFFDRWQLYRHIAPDSLKAKPFCWLDRQLLLSILLLSVIIFFQALPWKAINRIGLFFGQSLGGGDLFYQVE